MDTYPIRNLVSTNSATISSNGVDTSQKTALTRVMIVEDGQLFRQALMDALAEEPKIQVVHVAETGEEALEAFGKAFPDLVFMDFRLPGMNGLEAAKRMKLRRPDVRVAILTAYSDEVLIRILQEVETVEFMPKASFNLDNIQHLLKKRQ